MLWVVVPGFTVLPKSCRYCSFGTGGGGQPDQPRRPEAVVQVLVGLVADSVRCQLRRKLPAASDASDVLRHRRAFPSAALTVTGRSVKFDMYKVPVSPFSGRPPPLACEANLGSRHVPVHSVLGSILLLDHVSL